MKKIVLFVLAAIAMLVVLSHLPSTAQASRTIIVPTPTVAPVISSR